jgi:hypothetical protein
MQLKRLCVGGGFTLLVIAFIWMCWATHALLNIQKTVSGIGWTTSLTYREVEHPDHKIDADTLHEKIEAIRREQIFK